MKKGITILLLIMVIFAGKALCQKPRLSSSPFYRDYVMRTLEISVDLKQTYKLIDTILEKVYENRNSGFSYTVEAEYNMHDTIIEFVKVDTCFNCRYEIEWERPFLYYVGLNKNLDRKTYLKIFKYAEKKYKEKKHYVYREFYRYLIYSLQSEYYTLIANKFISEEEIKKIFPFFNELNMMIIKDGEVDLFMEKYFKENFVTDEVIKEVINQFKEPKFPEYYLKQYMEDIKYKWDPKLIDTTGIPEKYKVRYEEFEGCNERDTLCYNCRYIIRMFWYYHDLAKKWGITPQEALYRSYAELNTFGGYNGYKKFTYVIDYAIEKNDNRLLPVIKEFIRKHPDYPLTESQKEYFEKH